VAPQFGSYRGIQYAGLIIDKPDANNVEHIGMKGSLTREESSWSQLG